MNKQEFLKKVMREAGLQNIEQAEEVSKAIMHTLKRRITKEEAKDLESQLSFGEKELWQEEYDLLGNLYNIRASIQGVEKMHKNEFLSSIDNHSNHKYNPEKIAKAVFHVIKEQITTGESKDITGQLPKDLKDFWEKA